MEVNNLQLVYVNLKFLKRCTVVRLLLFFWLIHFHSTSGNYFSATHKSYVGSTYNITFIAAIQIAGNVDTATQQCRRNCVLDPNCRASQVILLKGMVALGSFECRFYDLNLCNWQIVAINNIALSGFTRIWENLDGSQLKAKPCVEYCAVKYNGDCNACRGYSSLTGLDCDEAPRLCSGRIGDAPDSWSLFPVWPWGFYNRMLRIPCYNKQTVIFRVHFVNPTGPRVLQTLGWPFRREPTTLSQFSDMVKDIDWPLISELQAMSTRKELYLYLWLDSTGPRERTFTGFKISPNGSLSLNDTLGNEAYNGFNTPVNNAPFISEPTGSGIACGAFWRLSSEPVCQYGMRFLNLEKVVWGGIESTYFGSAILAFD